MFSSSFNSSQSILEINNTNNNINDLSQTISLPQVFGPFYRSSKFFIKKDIGNERNKFKKIILLLILFLLIIRSIYYIFELLFRTENLTITWAKTSIQLTITLNGLSSFFWLYKNGSEYFNKFIFELNNFIKNVNIQQLQQLNKNYLFIRPFIFLFIFIFTSIIWCSLQIIQIQQQKGLVNITMEKEEEENDTRISYLMGIKIFLYILFNLFPSLLTAYIGAITLCIFHISFKNVFLNWEIFKKELFIPLLNNGQIMNLQIFNQIEISISLLLRLSHFTSDCLASLGNSLFINAIFLNLAAGFITGGGGEGNGGEGHHSSLLYNIFFHINNINWSLLSIILLIYILKGPYAVHSIIHEIKDQLLLSENIWINNNNDEIKLKLCDRTKNLIKRIEGIQIHRIGQQLFNLVFIGQMVLLWLLVANSKCYKN